MGNKKMNAKEDTCFWCGEFLENNFCNNCYKEENSGDFLDFLERKAKEHGAKKAIAKIILNKKKGKL